MHGMHPGPGVRLLQMRCWRVFPACSRTASTVPSCGGTSDLSLRRLRDFVSGARRLLVIGGAGVSTESGIPDYRSEGVGLYARTDRRPMQHAEFVRSAGSRQRYWARNFVGWPLFSSHQPNPAHLTLRRWEEKGLLHWLVTQNVDALHSKAGHQGLTELHGCAHRVVCLGCGEVSARDELQDRFVALNPGWTAQAGAVAPDGDVFLEDEQVLHFRVPACAACGGVLKPEVTFFGDTVNKATVQLVHERLAEADAVLVAGSSLQVYSGYRFLLAASDKKLPIAILNIGPTRADHLAEVKVEKKNLKLNAAMQRTLLHHTETSGEKAAPATPTSAVAGAAFSSSSDPQATERRSALPQV